ncbi:hypothetical protein PV-S19_0095 [Pacmanvirus S19]|nr:hypothetical protein PV-S19_0095 [Pacmanvirus S19]
MEGVNTQYVDYGLPNASLKVYDKFIAKDLADFYFETFQLMPFEQGNVRGGKEKRKTCFYSELRNEDGSLRKYYYAGKENIAYEFIDELKDLKEKVEITTGSKFNSCLVNLYEDGKQIIGWHSDSVVSLYDKNPVIASVSLGAERWFDVKAKDNAPNPDLEYNIRTLHGSMIVMGGTMQKYYQHRIRQEAKVKEPRINLTFRLSK